jgi:hypothetical protein
LIRWLAVYRIGATSGVVERVILRAIEKYARGNPEALACDIIAALGRAGFVIVPRETNDGLVAKKKRRPWQGRRAGRL